MKRPRSVARSTSTQSSLIVIQCRIVLDRFIQCRIVLSSFYSAMNRSRTVRPFHLNGEGVLYNGRGHSVFVSLCKTE